MRIVHASMVPLGWTQQPASSSSINIIADKMLKVKKPGLWFSTNSEWEFSAFKRFNDGKKEFDLNKPDEFEKYIGCARLITKLDSRFVTYAKYKYKSKAHPLVWEKIGEVGRSKGANPEEWYATFSPINVDNLDIEVYDNGSWYSLKKEDGEFDTELFNKNLEKTFIYKRGKELESKMEKEPVETKQEVPVVEEVKEEEPVLEEVKDEKPVEEELNPEGFMSKVRGFFGRFKKKK